MQNYIESSMMDKVQGKESTLVGHIPFSEPYTAELKNLINMLVLYGAKLSDFMS
jgi:hypothetical protein